ncbi:hypothetical protein N7519_001639 [Penicillium mononematosum]|uniref:uncharacterized protein n=1 Tax=Penicillium mononematosum TaxID=268346 RepID=UPI002548B734|nr:uncharacterized protein N7519_001639 [Penicillium mononematosum]KAJ6191618.1 hypothetical protein N7519_001639 [Penicillium mononematosum]
MVTKAAAVSHSLSSSWTSISKWIANISINQAPVQSARLRQPSTARPYHAAVWPSYGITTPVPDQPFVPPQVALSIRDWLRSDKRLSVKGELVRGLNNGDDAIIVAENFIGVDDGVGAWATKPRGHAALWSRLLLHFWALEVEKNVDHHTPTLDPVGYLQYAYEETLRATTSPTEWLGTTTSATAILHCTKEQDGTQKPLLYVTNLGDCKILVIRPSEKKVLFRTAEQWHWFDCPMQLGTNSMDTPRKDAVLSKIAVQEDDVVLALSDGVMDNLWEHEVLKVVIDSIDKWEEGRAATKNAAQHPHLSDDRNVYVARELLNAALTIAQDPFAESPFMEKAVEEGLAIEGGKMDDISVVIASCKKSDG